METTPLPPPASAGQEPTFPRTPIPSAPATSAISKLQIALNNLIGHVTEAVYFTAEMAPQLSFDTSNNDETCWNDVNKEILTRATNIESIIRSIHKFANDLPDSSRTDAYYEERIENIQKESIAVTHQLINSCKQADTLTTVLRNNIQQLATTLSSEHTTTSIDISD